MDNMKNLKGLVALVLAMVMVLSVASVAFADETSTHTLTITDADQYVVHTFTAYQVFKGSADGTGTKLANITWGDGVNSAAIISAINSDTNAALASLRTAISGKSGDAAAAALAEALGVSTNFADTSDATASAGALDAFAEIVAANTTGSGVALTESNTNYTGIVTGDGYYIVKDATATLTGTNGSDTKSKNILLPVLKDTTAVAKDTHITPDKEIVAGSERVKEGTAAVGDIVTFEVTIKVPNTKKYVDHFCFQMQDTLPTGMTFTGITSVKVGTDDVAYTLTVAAAGSDTYATYTAPTAPATTTGGQKIKVVFNNFKANAEANNWIGKDLVVTYTAVVNKDADFTPTGNINEVKFDYSNDPNHDYDGDEPGPNEPHGVTPSSTTKTVLVNIEINKTDGTSALAGAEFEITSNDYNVALVTGEKFELSTYTAAANETVQSGTYYKLKDGTYTTTAPNSTNTSSYDSTSDTYVKVTFTKAVTTPGTTKKITVISDESGKIVLNGLKPGTYTIKETKAPSGFNLDSTEHTIVINAAYDSTTKTITLSGTIDGSATGWDGTTAKASITIVNKAGVELPSTGGIGTTLFYIVGVVMVLGAAAVMVARRKSEQE